MNEKTRLRLRGMLPWLLALVLSGLASLLPPIAQPLSYHAFADQRACLGMPRCLDTLSNACFVAAGVAGLFMLHRAARWDGFNDRREVWPYRLFFVAAVLLGVASGYYHLAPDNGRLLWDRLAMMLVFVAWLSAIVCERAGCRAGLRLMPIFLVAGLGSVAWWGWSEARGMGDLRPYLLMQVYAAMLVPLLRWQYPPRYTGDRILLAVLGLYALALLGDLGDRIVFEATGGLVSGHTAKHAIAAVAIYAIARHIRGRHAL